MRNNFLFLSLIIFIQAKSVNPQVMEVYKRFSKSYESGALLDIIKSKGQCVDLSSANYYSSINNNNKVEFIELMNSSSITTTDAARKKSKFILFVLENNGRQTIGVVEDVCGADDIVYTAKTKKGLFGKKVKVFFSRLFSSILCSLSGDEYGRTEGCIKNITEGVRTDKYDELGVVLLIKDIAGCGQDAIDFIDKMVKCVKKAKREIKFEVEINIEKSEN